MSEPFLFDTICDDIIGEILQYIKWCKACAREKGKKDPYMFSYHRLLWIERPIITYRINKWFENPEIYYAGAMLQMCKGKLDSCDLHHKTGRKRAIKKDKKGLISYTYEQGKSKEIAM